jgi:hypothetical protein
MKIHSFIFSRRRRHSSNDLKRFTLRFNKRSSKTNKVLDDDDEGNRRASESLFRSLPELRYRYYVINAACVFFSILVIQALIFEKYNTFFHSPLFYIFYYSRNTLYLILVISGVCAFSIAALLCVLDLSKVNHFSKKKIYLEFILVTT